jgi:hypothetical protein
MFAARAALLVLIDDQRGRRAGLLIFVKAAAQSAGHHSVE